MRAKAACRNCAFFQAFYVRGFTRFFKEEQGLYCNSQKVVLPQGACECFQPLPEVDEAAALKLIDNAFQDMKELEKIYSDYPRLRNLIDSNSGKADGKP